MEVEDVWPTNVCEVQIGNDFTRELRPPRFEQASAFSHSPSQQLRQDTDTPSHFKILNFFSVNDDLTRAHASRATEFIMAEHTAGDQG